MKERLAVMVLKDIEHARGLVAQTAPCRVILEVIPPKQS